MRSRYQIAWQGFGARAGCKRTSRDILHLALDQFMAGLDCLAPIEATHRGDDPRLASAEERFSS
jgi:hypothetical protein